MQQETQMNTMRTTLMAAAAFALMLGTAQAQRPDRQPDPQRVEAVKELRETMKSWTQSTIVPVLGRWKAQLDGAMEPTDLQKLNELRSRAASLKKERMEHVVAMREAWKNEDYASLKSHREALKGMRDKRKELMEQLKPLAMKYRSTLEEIGKTAKPQVEQWKQEGKAKVETWAAQHQDVLDGKGGKFKGMWKHWGKFAGLDNDTKRKMAAARFMLWDGGDFTRDMDQMMERGGDGGFGLK
jgi:hypothetical protein